MVLADFSTVTLTFDLKTQGSYATKDGCVDQVWGRYLKAFLSYWTERDLKHLTLVTLTFDPVTPKSIGFLCWLGWMCGPSLRKFTSRCSRVIDRKRFWHIWPWPLTSISLGFLCCPGLMSGPSLRKVQFFSYWSETKRLQTDQLTERHVQSNVPSLLWRGA